MIRWFAAALIALTPLLVRADLKQFVGEETLFVAEADLTRIDPAVVEPWVRRLFAAAGVIDGPTALPAAEVDFAAKECKRWLADVAAAGGKRIYVVGGDQPMQDGAFAFVIPAEAGGDAKKLAALLFSGRPDGPINNAGGRAQHRFNQRAEVVNGNLAVYGAAGMIEFVKKLKPVDRADVNAALAAIGDVPVRAIVAPTAKARAFFASQLPEGFFGHRSTAIHRDLHWIAAGLSLPPTAGVKLVTLSADAESAKTLNDLIAHALAAASGVPSKISPDMAKMLTPTLANNQSTLTADDAKLLALAKELATPLAMARKQALVVKGMSNMRQILMACHMHANENKGKWPEDLKDAKKFVPKLDQLMINPLHPEMKPAFVYIKPVNPRAGAGQETIVLYEAHKDFADGVSVGYLDGHVERIVDKKRFDKQLAESAVEGPGQ